MNESNRIMGVGTIVAAQQTGRLFVESPEHYYAVPTEGTVRLQPGDEVEFETIYGDQYASATSVKGRRVS
jgi:cold shock CspA family protein